MRGEKIEDVRIGNLECELYHQDNLEVFKLKEGGYSNNFTFAYTDVLVTPEGRRMGLV